MPLSEADQRPRAPRPLALLVPVTLVGAVLALIAPVPAWLVDMLVAGNLAAAVIILLQTIQVRQPRDFSVFPVLLLATTLTRLVLNVATTRLVLTEAPIHGTAAAGGVIEAFGEFVAAGSPLVGGVVFAILVVIQFVVMTKGASRISEVAARFALDGMPGRQAAVDAELGSGLITPEEARGRREEIAQQADFYGAMDGASRFVRGDAIAGVLITLVNILGGLAIGIVGHGMSLSEAIDIYTTLTIGDGLVSQVPAFLMALAAGLIVTRSSTASDLSQDLVSQMTGSRTALVVGAAFLAVMAFTGFPMLPLLSLSAACLIFGLMVPADSRPAAPAVVETSTAPTAAVPASSPVAGPSKASPAWERQLLVEPLELDLGVSLVRLADRAANGDLLERVTHLRETLAGELGFLLPKVRIQDDLRLDPRQFRIKLRGAPAATGTVYADAWLAVDDGFLSEEPPGIAATEPATGRRAVWVDAAHVAHARQQGYRVVAPQAVILQVLEQVVHRHAGELLTREHVYGLLTHLHERAPRLVDELVPSRLTGGEVHRVLATLLSEGVSIRDLEAILEALSDAAGASRRIEELTSAVRIALRRNIVEPCRDERGLLHVVRMDGFDSTEISDLATRLSGLNAERRREMPDWFGRLLDALDRLTSAGHRAVVVGPGESRRAICELLVQTGVSATVLAYRELPPDVTVRVHADIQPSVMRDELHVDRTNSLETSKARPITQADPLNAFQLAAA